MISLQADSGRGSQPSRHTGSALTNSGQSNVDTLAEAAEVLT